LARLITFGGLSVRNGTVINGLANPRSRLAILAVLAVAGDRGVRREKLAALFWPESDDEKGRNALRQALFTLKRDLGAGEITLGNVDLRLNPDVLTADVTEFDVAIRDDRVEDAAALYAGPFLDGVFVRESPEFERWVDEQRSRLAGQFGHALEKMAQTAAMLNDHQAALQWLERLSKHDPYSGRVARHHMEALVKVGEREKALRHATAYTALVRKDLEVEPDPGVVRLARDIRSSTRDDDRQEHLSQGEPSIVIPQPNASVADIPRPEPSVEQSRPGGAHATRASARPKRAWVSAVAVAVLALTLGITYVVASARDAAPAAARSVAVLAFRDEADDSSLGVVADLIRSEIINGLNESKLADVARSDVVDDLADARQGPGGVRSRAFRSRWMYVVSGRLIRNQDSLVVLTELWQPYRGTTFRMVSVAAPAETGNSAIARAVRNSVVAAMAPRLDPLFADWADAFTPPISFAAYTRFADAIRLTGPDKDSIRIRLFREATALDSTFSLAPLSALFVDGLALNVRDSIAGVLESQRGRLTDLERALLDYYPARRSNRLRRFLAGKRLVELAPESDWLQFMFANDAATMGRHRDALAALQAIDTAGAWLASGDKTTHFAFTRNVNHALGQHEAALDAVRRAIAHRPDMGFLRRMELVELAALGRAHQVDSVLRDLDNWSRSPVDGITALEPWVFAVEEFAAHGHESHANRLATRFDSVVSLVHDTLRARPRIVNSQARALIAIGRPREALAALDRLAAPPGWESLSLIALAAGAVGDRSRADSTVTMLISRSQNRQRAVARGRAAQVYALLGDRSRATATLRQALLEGADWVSLRHDRPAADSLRRYPGLEALVRETR
jgi:DNA-binding SARP family transcriptional activator/tetratricopeptide (TPR) repeat protein/TolB-like protein